MSFMLIAIAFCLVAMSGQLFKLNTASDFVFPEIKYFSFLNTKIPAFNPVKLLYSNDINHIISIFKELVSKVHKKINVFIEKTNIHKFSWNWTWFPDYCRSKFKTSDFSCQIENELFGQHIISWSLPRLLNDHLKINKPSKPFLMSFQGPTGCGKSFTIKMIVDNLFKEGFNSNFVHTYYGSQDFFREKEKDNYRKRLLHEIPFLLSLCDRSVFIFEEVDKMVPGVIDAILPYIYFHENSTDTFSTNSIFIFVSNSGAKEIEEMVYDAWLKGIPREGMTLADFSSCLNATLCKELGGLQNSEIIKRNLIDVFLPFLPLEREHVKQCILRELKLRGMSVIENRVEYVADQIIYHPPEFELFSESGCKRVSQKVDLFGEY